MKRVKKIFIIALSSALLIGCGGGGSSNNKAPKKWKGAELLENKNYYADSAQIVLNKNGDGAVIWRQKDSNGYKNIYAKRYIAGSGWGNISLLETKNSDAEYPHISINDNGEIAAIWAQKKSSGGYDIYANYFTPGNGWSGAILLETANGNAIQPTISIDNNGNAIALWRQYDSSGAFRIYSSRYTANSGWSNASLLQTGTGNAGDPQIAFDNNGNAIALWFQKDSSGYDSIYANRYSINSGWSGAAVIETKNSNAHFPHLAFDKYGNAIALWQQKDSSGNYSIYANRYSISSGWDTPTLLETNNNSANYSKITVDENGNAIAIWYQKDNSGVYSIYANRYTPNSGWSGATLLENGNKDAFFPSIALDSQGNAIAVWEQKDSSGVYSIYANRYTPNSGWSGAILLENGNKDAFFPNIALDGNGNAIAVWFQKDNSNIYSIYANRFAQ